MIKELKKCNVTVGRFQPFTEGHMKMVEAGYKENNLPCVILQIPNTKNDTKHPFTDELIREEIKFIMNEQKNANHTSIAGHFYVKNADIAKIAKTCHENGFEPVLWLCGSDRYPQYSKQADTEKYKVANDMLMEFKAFEVKRTDDDTSATKVRQAIKDDDFTTYMRMMPQGFDENTPLWEKFKKELSQIKEGMQDISSFMAIKFNPKRFLNEDLNNSELRKTLVDYIKNKENKIRNKDLKKAINILQTISDDDFEKLKSEIFTNNEIGLKLLCDILNKVGSKNKFLESLFTKDKFPTFEDLNKSSNLFEIIKNNEAISNIFDDDLQLQEFMTRLISCDYKDKQGKGVGKGELFLYTLFKDTSNPKRGDVKIEDKEIEVKMSKGKANGGRLLASKQNLKSPKELVKKIQEILDINDSFIISGPSKMQELYNNLTKKKDDKEVFKAICNAYLYQFDWCNEKQKEFDKIINSLDIEDKVGEQFIKIHGCLALIEYHNVDKWDYMLVGNYVGGHYVLIDGNTINIDNFTKSFNTIYNDKRIEFKDGPNSTKGANAQNYAARIYVKI